MKIIKAIRFRNGFSQIMHIDESIFSQDGHIVFLQEGCIIRWNIKFKRTIKRKDIKICSFQRRLRRIAANTQKS